MLSNKSHLTDGTIVGKELEETAKELDSRNYRAGVFENEAHSPEFKGSYAFIDVNESFVR